MFKTIKAFLVGLGIVGICLAGVLTALAAAIFIPYSTGELAFTGQPQNEGDYIAAWFLGLVLDSVIALFVYGIYTVGDGYLKDRT